VEIRTTGQHTRLSPGALEVATRAPVPRPVSAGAGQKEDGEAVTVRHDLFGLDGIGHGGDRAHLSCAFTWHGECTTRALGRIGGEDGPWNHLERAASSSGRLVAQVATHNLLL
jgi:hypothetical protein